MATNPLELSDEDFLKQPEPTPVVEENKAPEQQQQEEKPEAKEDPAAQAQEDEGLTEAEKAAAAVDADENEDGDNKSGEKEEKPDNQQEQKPADRDADKSGKPEEKTPEGETKVNEEKPGKEAEAPSSGSETIDYEDFHKQIMAPFKANGKEIELKNLDEVRQLMQMGANYTKKMQQLAPARKFMTTLENNGLLDESKLNFLISLDKGDPEAIKKLLLDKGVDPLDIDTKVEPAYREGNYTATDQEVAFRTQLEELASSDTGKQTLAEIDRKWDQASQEMLWQNPDVMATIHQQREIGVYDLISAEMDRQRTLGQLSQSVPFLQAYKIVGDKLADAGAFKNLGGKQPETTEKPVPKVIGTSEGKPPVVAKNGDQAGAAAPSRTVPGKAREAANFLAMSDDDFMKSEKFVGRL